MAAPGALAQSPSIVSIVQTSSVFRLDDILNSTLTVRNSCCTQYTGLRLYHGGIQECRPNLCCTSNIRSSGKIRRNLFCACDLSSVLPDYRADICSPGRLRGSFPPKRISEWHSCCVCTFAYSSRDFRRPVSAGKPICPVRHKRSSRPKVHIRYPRLENYALLSSRRRLWTSLHQSSTGMGDLLEFLELECP